MTSQGHMGVKLGLESQQSGSRLPMNHYKASHGQEGHTCLSHPGTVQGAWWALVYTCRRVNNCVNGCEALDKLLILSECQ